MIDMKKFVFLLCVICLVFSAGCSSNGTNNGKTNSTELTTDNISEYLVLYGDYSGTGTSYKGEKKTTGYSNYVVKYDIKSQSSMYQFYDATIDLDIILTYYPAKKAGQQYGIGAGTYAKSETKTVSITLDNEGNASGSCEISISPDIALFDEFLKVQYSPVSVSGSVSSKVDE